MTPKHFIFFVCLLANIAAWASPSDSVMFRVYIDKLWGIVNTKGEYVVPPQYEWMGKFSENGFVPVRTFDGLFGYVSKNGTIINPQYYYAGSFSNGLACVKLHGKKVLLTRQVKFGLIFNLTMPWIFQKVWRQ